MTVTHELMPEDERIPTVNITKTPTEEGDEKLAKGKRKMKQTGGRGGGAKQTGGVNSKIDTRAKL